MKYPHIVNHNGVWYPAGTEVPVDAPKKEEPKVEVKPVEVEKPADEIKQEPTKQATPKRKK